MKKLLYIITPLLISHNIIAQNYNTHPVEDEVFLQYLVENFPEAIINDSLNMDNVGIIDSIYIYDQNVFSVNEISLFTNLYFFRCAYSNLTSLPELPISLIRLDVEENNLTDIPLLPEDLSWLNISSNAISLLPDLPENLNWLACGSNQISSLPEYLPSQLWYFSCADNNISNLPNTLPSGLTSFSCHNNNIETLPELPNNLEYFQLNDNSIYSLPDLPVNLDYLNITNNPIICVGDYPPVFEPSLSQYPSCLYGCTEPNAQNYNQDATVDDGSCLYSTQQLLNNGSSIQDIIDLGYPIDSLYGKLYEGGYIFYLNETNDGGLVVNPESFSSGQEYGWQYSTQGQWNTYDCNGCEGESIGTGLANNIQWTNSIFTKDNTSYAIGFANNLTSGFYSDWFIPSLNEALELTNNLTFLFELYPSLSSFWTSTEKKVKSFYNNGNSIILNNTGGHYASKVTSNGEEIVYETNSANLLPIRKFGSWTEGCMNDKYIEYSPIANFDDNSCSISLIQHMLNEGNSINEIISSGVEPAELIGLYYGGGQIAHLHPEDGRTIILSPEQSQIQMPWYCSEYISNMSLSNDWFQAHLNQFEILENCNSLYSPALYSEQLEINGYNDWVFPSHFDFEIIKINLFRSSLGDFDLTDIDWPFDIRYHTSSATTAELKISQYSLSSQFFFSDSYNNIRTIRFEGNWDKGCIDANAVNYDLEALVPDSCNYSFINGCMDELYIEYNFESTIDDGSCEILLSEALDSLNNELEEINEQATTSLSSLQQALDTWNTTIDLDAGWNMFGYGCPTSIGVAEGLSNHTESILITKDNNGNVYMPEWDFNGIGDFTPGFGYQIKVTEAIEGFSLCDWYVNDIPEDNIVSLQEEVENLQAELDSIYGCIDESACNYDFNATINNNTCIFPEQCYDCDGNEYIQYQVGDFSEGGVIFYVDETGCHGLVAAMEDVPGSFEWGCDDEFFEGADGMGIGTGYQNTIDIVNQGCISVNGGAIAAQAALDFQIDGFTDWYLPSFDELYELYIIIVSENIDISIELQYDWYRSSSQNTCLSYQACVIHAGGSTDCNSSRAYEGKVRPIRSF